MNLNGTLQNRGCCPISYNDGDMSSLQGDMAGVGHCTSSLLACLPIEGNGAKEKCFRPS